jgi:hypothetical protein
MTSDLRQHPSVTIHLAEVEELYACKVCGEAHSLEHPYGRMGVCSECTRKLANEYGKVHADGPPFPMPEDPGEEGLWTTGGDQ